MYETHGSLDTPSSRYRDLVDLVLIVESMPIDDESTRRAILTESRQRDLTLPTTLVAPHPSWKTEYPKLARGSRMIEPALCSLEASMTYVGRCLNPLLDGTETKSLRWDPARQEWSEQAT